MFDDINQNPVEYDKDYYQQLHDLGILVDGVDLSRDSVDDFVEVDSRADSNGADGNKEQQDLIAEYLASEYRREEEEEEENSPPAGRRSGLRGTQHSQQSESGVGAEPYSRASSARTVSSHSFPDDAEDFVSENLSQNLGSQVATLSQKTTGDDEEIFSITSRILPTSPADVLKSGYEPPKRGSFSMKAGGEVYSTYNKNSSFSGVVNQSRGNTPNFRPNDSHDDARSVYSESTPIRSRPSSTTSHMSTASEIVSARQKKAEELATQRMSKARSQESFFEGEQTPKKSVEKSHQKRLLPTMSSSEPSHSFKVKSKSVSNIANKTGPVKPTHMTVLEISRLTNMEHPPALPWEDNQVMKRELGEETPVDISNRLTQEAQKRKQATELVQQLQKDYDNLLTKYALAELTIDQMRLGAKITLHTDSPTPGQAHTGVLSPVPGQTMQVMSMRHSSSQAQVLRSSPAQGMMGHMSTFTGRRTLFIFLFLFKFFFAGNFPWSHFCL